MSQATSTAEEPQEPRRGHGHARRPPLAEVDSWELWQAWRRGERRFALPWIGLLVAFCVVLAGMYSFFFYSTSLDNDTVAQVGLTLLFVAFLFRIWRRISPRRGFALIVITLMLLISGLAFLTWLLAYALSGWNPWAAIGGTVSLGLIGLFIGLPSLNTISRQQDA